MAHWISKRLFQGVRPGDGRPRRHLTGRSLRLEGLEGRRLLAGDVTAEVVDDTLEISGDADSNSIVVDTVRRLKADAMKVTGGVTSVFLDLPLLASVGLELSSISDDTVTPAEGNFQVGFPITSDSDFVFSTKNGLTPLSGQIAHIGTVGFNDDQLVIGDFSIGFDPTRVGETASGFFVADTFLGLGPLFDIGAPGEVDVDRGTLTIEDADLLVSPELATILENEALIGVDVGDAQIDAETVAVQHRRVDGGKTSVELDLGLLETVGLSLSSANGTADPAADNFQVAFKILHDSDFVYQLDDGFAPVAGTINHKGTVGFNEDSIVVGDFAIGFDATRAGDQATGFFVADTFSDLGILFDVGGEVGLDATGKSLTITSADLLVSPEFATLLGNEALVGVDVGNAQVDAEATRVYQEFIRIRGGYAHGSRTQVNGGRSAEVLADEFSNILIDTGGGRDKVQVRRTDVAGDLRIALGDGRYNQLSLSRVNVDGVLAVLGGGGNDRVSGRWSSAASLAVETGDGNDRVSLTLVSIADDAKIDLGDGRDSLRVILSSIGGTASFDGGSGQDRFDSVFSRYGELERDNFERGRLF